MTPLGIYNFDFSISLSNVIRISKVPVSRQMYQIIKSALFLFFSWKVEEILAEQSFKQSQTKVH